MKNIKPFSDIFEEDQKAKLAQNMADDENAEKMEEELKEAFMRYLLNVFKILEEVKECDLIIREQYYLDIEKPVYNICKTAGSKLGTNHSEATRDKISKSHEGKKASLETRALLSSLKQGSNHPNFGKHLAKKTRDLIADSKRGEKHHQFGKTGDLHHNSKAIIQKDLNGNFVRRWGSSGEIYKETGFNHRNIREACSNGKRKQAHGFKWEFEKC